jgi:hypothetical protein
VLVLENTSAEISKLWLKHLSRNFDVFIEGRLCRMKGLVWPGTEWPQSPIVGYKIADSSNVDTSYWLSLLGEQPIAPLLPEDYVDTAGRFINNYGFSHFAYVLANPIPYVVFRVFRIYRKRSLSRRDLILLALPLFIVLSIFLGGVGYEPRYVWPATAISILALLTEIPRVWGQGKSKTELKRFSQELDGK